MCEDLTVDYFYLSLCFTASGVEKHLMGFHDVAFMPYGASFYTSFIKYCDIDESHSAVKTVLENCLRTVVWGRPRHALFETSLLQLILCWCRLNLWEITELSYSLCQSDQFSYQFL